MRPKWSASARARRGSVTSSGSRCRWSAHFRKGWSLGCVPCQATRMTGTRLMRPSSRPRFWAGSGRTRFMLTKGIAVPALQGCERRGMTRRLKAELKRRSAIEPTIGHMKNDGRLGRNWLKGALGERLHAVLCGAGHNLRMILRKLRLLFALVFVGLLVEQQRFSQGNFAVCQASSVK